MERSGTLGSEKKCGVGLKERKNLAAETIETRMGFCIARAIVCDSGFVSFAPSERCAY